MHSKAASSRRPTAAWFAHARTWLELLRKVQRTGPKGTWKRVQGKERATTTREATLIEMKQR